jgi:hypothetical protein
MGKLTLDKCYVIIYTVQTNWVNDDICINADDGSDWWFGQIGEMDCWTSWFVTEKEWLRDKRLTELGI